MKCTKCLGKGWILVRAYAMFEEWIACMCNPSSLPEEEFIND